MTERTIRRRDQRRRCKQLRGWAHAIDITLRAIEHYAPILVGYGHLVPVDISPKIRERVESIESGLKILAEMIRLDAEKIETELQTKKQSTTMKTEETTNEQTEQNAEPIDTWSQAEQAEVPESEVPESAEAFPAQSESAQPEPAEYLLMMRSVIHPVLKSLPVLRGPRLMIEAYIAENRVSVPYQRYEFLCEFRAGSLLEWYSSEGMQMIPIADYDVMREQFEETAEMHMEGVATQLEQQRQAIEAERQAMRDVPDLRRLSRLYVPGVTQLVGV